MAPQPMTPVDAGFALDRKPTRHDVFPAKMDKVVSWLALCAVVELHHLKTVAASARRTALR